jgi:hypothetical protein
LKFRIILPDPDQDRHPGHAYPDTAIPDRYKFQASVFFNFFPENFNMLSKIHMIMTPLPLMRMEKQCKLLCCGTGTVVP